MPRGVAEVATLSVLAPDDERFLDDARTSAGIEMGSRVGSCAARGVNEGVKVEAEGLKEKVARSGLCSAAAVEVEVEVEGGDEVVGGGPASGWSLCAPRCPCRACCSSWTRSCASAPRSTAVSPQASVAGESQPAENGSARGEGEVLALGAGRGDSVGSLSGWRNGSWLRKGGEGCVSGGRRGSEREERATHRDMT